jgi:hypothetical protein
MASPESAPVAVALIHGIGTQNPDFAEATLERLGDRLRGAGVEPEAWVGWGIHWQPALNAAQRAYLERATAAHDLDWQDLRSFVVHSLGDAAAYQRPPEPGRTPAGANGDSEGGAMDPGLAIELRSDDAYQRVHALLAESLRQRVASDPRLAEAPLVVGAHSLGAHVFSNFAWDWLNGDGRAQRAYPEIHDSRRSALERMRTLAGIVTFGANLPLFLFGLERAVPLPFPPPEMAERFGGGCRWLNLFDRDDPLGWPLQPINEAFAEAVHEDRVVRLRGPAAPTPLAHNAYWTDEALIDALAQQVMALLGA